MRQVGTVLPVSAAGTGLPRIPRPVLARRLAGGLEAGSVLLVAGAGYGKTMALEEAIALAGRRAAWVPCRDAGGEAGRLLISALKELRAAVPGLADVLGDRLTAGLEPVDVDAATAALLAELERLLVEPLVIVFDDAEELEGAGAALALVDRLLTIRAPLAVAVATRRALPLKLAKLRASGRLVEVGPAELAFTAAECEELLRLRQGRALSDAEVGAVVATSEGWPMGVALTSLTGVGEPATAAIPREDLFEYLAEEVLDHLEPALRLAIVDSSVPATLTPAVIDALGLPPDFVALTERQGLFLRAQPSGVHSYHPLFRAFLRERLRDLRSEPERQALHERTAASLVASGRPAEAIEHWLAAGRFAEALGALVTHGAELVRTSPRTVRAWLAGMPDELRAEPDYFLVKGQLLWGAGKHHRAAEPLHAAVIGYAGAGARDHEWVARALLADTLIFTGDFTDVVELAAGWEEASGPIARLGANALAWYDVMALSALGRLEEAQATREALLREENAALFALFDSVANTAVALPAGRGRDALERLRKVIADLALDDPLGRLPYALGMAVLVLRDLGEWDAALEWLDRCEHEAERAGIGFMVRDSRRQRASLLAQRGELGRAELELSRAGTEEGTGWRTVHEGEAEAQIAMLRGDAAAAMAAAQRALAAVAPGPLPWRVWASVEMGQVLARAGAPDLARDAIATTLAALDETFPGADGRLHRARLLAARAGLELDAGARDAAAASLRESWEQAAGDADQVVRAHWPALRPVLWHALAEGAISHAAVLPALQAALPGGEALLALIDHPDAAVRRAALLAALGAGHPALLAQLGALGEDADEQVAAAAAAMRERLRHQPPPLRFELLGRFHVRRAGWEIDEAAWGRPMAARLVRFLLLQRAGAVPEDTLFEAFWADRDADSARQHLAVALSRARKVLDLPGAEQSVIETRERTYRLRLRERDSVDSVEFETAATRALATEGRDRRALLERAATLWTGEPLPEDRFSAWSFAWRERLVETYSQVLNALIDGYEAAGEHHDAIRAAQRLLDIDPLNERAHRQLMAAYARTGRTSYALRQYLECRRALVVELGVEPSAETSQLQARILAGGPV
jgi:ATP/maltotriose-dependent transcriptional regulator MalT/DNA-binding SARP family transcriptional activator